jgi:hypothetical protein
MIASFTISGSSSVFHFNPFADVIGRRPTDAEAASMARRSGSLAEPWTFPPTQHGGDLPFGPLYGSLREYGLVSNVRHAAVFIFFVSGGGAV